MATMHKDGRDENPADDRLNWRHWRLSMPRFWLSFLETVSITLVVTVVATSIDRGEVAPLHGALVAFLVFMLVVGVNARRTARKEGLSQMLPTLSGRQELDEHRYILYLRPFDTDHRMYQTDRAGAWNVLTSLASHFGYGREADFTREERIIWLFQRLGQVVAVGHPEEQFPRPGAWRFYLPKDGDAWKPEVSDAMQRARLVILSAGIVGDPARAKGTLWEYSEAVRLLPPSRLVLLVTDGAGAYDRFREAAAEYFSRRAADLRCRGETLPPPPSLPDRPSLHRPRKLRQAPPLRGVIRFGDDWTATFVPFDPTAESRLTSVGRWHMTKKNQILPLLQRVEVTLPGRAVPPQPRWDRAWLKFSVLQLPILAYLSYLWGSDMPRSQKIAVVGSMMVMTWVAGGGFISSEKDRSLDSVKVVLPGDGEEPKVGAGNAV
ncbi:hypothetical protein [Streptomyces sp. BRA346]|uniref:hypothetical protein n=1 Tax=Streptomyces sp. BRA346 TaxID=2878199 RepID=UPI004063DF99